MHHDILTTMDKFNQMISAVTALDPSAAFDTIDHSTLLKVLEANFGVTHQALCWFSSNLSARKAQVCIGAPRSTTIDVPFSVPQRSCAGPVLYNIYFSTLEQHI